MIDVKKLITGFLILAVAAVCSGVILSFINTGGSSATAETSAGAQIEGVASSSPAVTMNAFIDTGTIQGNAAEVVADTDTSSTQAAAADPNNLTNVFANSFVTGLIAANPNGVLSDTSGTPIFNTPDTNSMAIDISSNPIIQNFRAPNWNIEADNQLIRINPTASPSDIAAYGDSLNAIFNKYFVATNLNNSLNSPASDPSMLAYVNTQTQGALNDALALKVPLSLVPLQKSLVKVLIFEKNSAQLGQLTTTDPIKASLILQGEESQYNMALTNLQQQTKQAMQLGLLFGKNIPRSSVPFIAQLFGVKPAQAIFGLGDITFDPSVFGQLIWQYTNDTVLQILKNSLVALIQRKVLTWIQGSNGHAPKFVTDFGTELVNSFQTAALNRLNSDIACVPLSEQHLLRVMLSTPPVKQNALNNSCAAEFQGQLGNTLNSSQLFNQFTNFNDFFTVLGGNNVWSNMIKIQDDALTAGSNSQTANQTQNIAQQGWKGSETCADGSNPNGTSTWCEGGLDPTLVDTCPDGNPPIGGICDDSSQPTPELQCVDGSAPTIIQNNGKCTDGSDPKITAPGQVTGQSMASVLKGGLDNITSASNISGILQSLLSSLLNTLAQKAINYANQAVNGTLTDSGVSGVNPSTLTPAPSSTTPTPTQCLPSIQSVILSTSTLQAKATLYANGGQIDATCASGGTCQPNENPDGTPTYSWAAPGSSGGALTGTPLQVTYTTPGTYFVTVTASTDNTTSSCEIDVQ